MGLSLSSKWSGVFLLAPIALGHVSSGNPIRLARKCRDVAILSLISLAIYILVTCALRHLSIQELFAQTVEMLQRHVNFTQPHRYASSAWGWPVLARPIWFGYTKLPYLAVDGSQAVRGTICVGNPAVFILTGLSVVWLVVVSLRDGLHRRARLVTTLPLVGYLACWVPWILLSSRKGFLYYFYPCLVFGCIGFGIACSAILAQRGKGFLLCAVAAILILAGFFTYIPLYVGAPTSITYMENILPWKTWW
jgi:dolichyl-phosphate-mannose--protein O-mannosyl transferase